MIAEVAAAITRGHHNKEVVFLGSASLTVKCQSSHLFSFYTMNSRNDFNNFVTIQNKVLS